MRGKDIGVRLAKWRSLLRSAEGGQSAWDVYAGEHWLAVRNLCREAQGLGLSPEVHVCSAGYGLIRAEDRIVPYRATFADGQLESVARYPEPRDDTNRAWWNGLVKGRRVGRLAGLVAMNPRMPILVAVSDVYLRAIRDDIEAALRLMIRPEQMLIVSGGATHAGELIAGRAIAPPGALRRVLGGTLTSLNVRAAALALTHLRRNNFDLDEYSCTLDAMAANIPPGEFGRGVQMSDESIIEFIQSRHPEEHSRSALHRTLRNQGLACEQRRFARLYQRAIEEALT